jgi:hypothetical protein
VSSPTARTLKLLRELGFEADVVERRVFRAVTKDFLGVVDVIGVKAGESPLGIQTTSASNAAARLTKARSAPRLRAWLAAGCRFEVWSWGKRGARWEVRRVELCGADLEPTDLTPRPKRRRKEKGLFDRLPANVVGDFEEGATKPSNGDG